MGCEMCVLAGQRLAWVLVFLKIFKYVKPESLESIEDQIMQASLCWVADDCIQNAIQCCYAGMGVGALRAIIGNTTERCFQHIYSRHGYVEVVNFLITSYEAGYNLGEVKTTQRILWYTGLWWTLKDLEPWSWSIFIWLDKTNCEMGKIKMILCNCILLVWIENSYNTLYNPFNIC